MTDPVNILESPSGSNDAAVRPAECNFSLFRLTCQGVSDIKGMRLVRVANSDKRYNMEERDAVRRETD